MPRKGLQLSLGRGKGKSTMKKTQLVVMAFVAVFAFSALITGSASAALTFEKAHFLVNGSEAPAKTVINSTGELRFENVLNSAAFTCSGLFEGTVGPSGTGEITRVVNLSGAEVKELPATGISCTNTKTCESAVANPDKLPFKVEAVKDSETGKFFVLIAGSYEFTCTVIGIKIEELCAPPAGGFIGGEITNLASDFEANAGATEPLATCNENAEEGLLTNIAGNLTATAITTNTLAVS